MTDSLDPDLEELLAGMGFRVVDRTALRGSGYDGYRPTAWRVRTADGRSVKARLFGNHQRAASVEEVLGCVRHAAFPRTFGRRERALLSEWIPGTSCAGRSFSLDEIREVGGILGFLHAAPVPESSRWGRRLDVAGWQERWALDLERLCAAGCLTASERDAADALARANVPDACTTALVHRDFCPENLVARDTGGFASVDNETLGIDTREFDLGRVWYRWPMSPAEREAFLDGYEQHSAASSFRAHQSFWLLVAAADAAVFRLTKSPEAARVPVAVLRGVLDEAEGDYEAENDESEQGRRRA